MAAAWAAYWHLFYVGQGWSPNIENTFAIVRNYAVRAIRLGRSELTLAPGGDEMAPAAGPGRYHRSRAGAPPAPPEHA